MKNLKTELAQVLINSVSVVVTCDGIISISGNSQHLAQAIIDSGLMVDRESVEGLYFAAKNMAKEMNRPGYWNAKVIASAFLEETLSKFQTKGETDAK